MTATLHRLATVATTVLVLVGVVGVGAYFIQAAATRRTAAVTTADCANKDFGPPLAPLGEPANLHQYHAAPPFTIDRDRLYEATIATKVGDIVVCLVPGWAPETVNSFVTLARNHFFDGLSWARDPSTAPGGPVIQGGSPHSNLTGGPGYKFKDEKVVSPLYRDGAYQGGAVAMANSGANTNGSQFFITLSSFTLPAHYNLFGQVVAGMDVAKKVRKGDVMQITVREQQP